MQSRNLFIILALIIAVIVMGNRGVQAAKDAALLASQIVVQDLQQPTQQNLAAVSSDDLVMCRRLVEYAAKANNVPVRVKLSGPDITITSATEVNKSERSDVEMVGSSSVPAQNKAAEKENKELTLANYKGLRDFLYTLSGLPYAVACKSFCVGETCGNAAIEIALTVVGKNQPQQQAPTGQQGQPPAAPGGGQVQDPPPPKKG